MEVGRNSPFNTQTQNFTISKSLRGITKRLGRAPTTLVLERNVDAVLASGHARVWHESRDRFWFRKMSRTSSGHTKPMTHCMTNIAPNLNIAAQPRSTGVPDSTHDTNRTGRSEVMVRVSFDADQARQANHNQSGKLTSIWFGS